LLQGHTASTTWQHGESKAVLLPWKSGFLYWPCPVLTSPETKQKEEAVYINYYCMPEAIYISFSTQNNFVKYYCLFYRQTCSIKDEVACPGMHREGTGQQTVDLESNSIICLRYRNKCIFYSVANVCVQLTSFVCMPLRKHRYEIIWS
jgi:hypothetical protein